jgi:predicted site-specific integrase-resolvase
MRLRDFANIVGVSYSTALRMFRSGKIPGAYRLPTGTISVPKESVEIIKQSGRQSIDLDRFIENMDSMAKSCLSQEDYKSFRKIIAKRQEGEEWQQQ